VSAVTRKFHLFFAARRYVYRGLCRRAVSARLSVRQSRSCYVERSKRIFHHLATPPILLCTIRYGNMPTAKPQAGASYADEVKNRDFRLISCFISEMIPDRAVITMERQ